MNTTVEKLIGKPVYDKELHKVGKISRLYSDGRSQSPTWATVRTGGFLGNKESFVPLSLAEFSDGDGEVILQTGKGVIADAPDIEPKGEVAPEDQVRLYQYYRNAILAEEPSATAEDEYDAAVDQAVAQDMSEGEHEVVLRKSAGRR